MRPDLEAAQLAAVSAVGTAVFNIEDNTLRWTTGARLGPDEYACTLRQLAARL